MSTTPSIQSEQVRLLYKHTPIGLAAAVINSCLLGFTLRNTIARPVVISWLFCILLITALRYLLFIQYWRTSTTSRESSWWGPLFIAGTTCSGLVWGSAGVFLFPEGAMHYQIFLAFVLGGMTAGSAVVYSPRKGAFLSFIVPTLLPVTIQFFLEGGSLFITMGLMTMVFLTLMLLSAAIMHRISLENFVLQSQKNELIAGLEAAKERAESSVARLESEISERLRIEEALRTSEKQFRMLVETMNEGLGMYDEEGLITFVNNKACETSGYSVGELLGRSVDILFDSKDHPMYQYQLAKRRRGKAALYEIELVGKGGRKIPSIVSSSPVLDERGAFKGAIVTVTDLSLLKKLERAQKESEEKYRFIFENAPVGIVHLDSEGAVTACNDVFASNFGLRSHHLIQKDLITLWENEEMRGALMQCLSGNVGSCEIYYSPPSGGENDNAIAIKAQYSPIFSEGGTLAGCIGIVVDISELKETEQALKASKEQLQQLSMQLLAAQEEERKRIAGELHDSIVSSLGAIKYSLEHICDSTEQAHVDPESIRPFTDMIYNTMGEVRNIISDLRPAILDDLGILATVGWHLRQFESIYSGIRTEFAKDLEEKDIPEELKIVIFRILQEALNNAAKYSQAGFVRVFLGKRDNTIELAIQDNGVGFDADSLRCRRTLEGGLGLNSMRERTELSGGSLEVDSGTGKGTTIRASWELT